jgi:hypothetical protein
LRPLGSINAPPFAEIADGHRDFGGIIAHGVDEPVAIADLVLAARLYTWLGAAPMAGAVSERVALPRTSLPLA